jgi:hypothetical protein
MNRNSIPRDYCSYVQRSCRITPVWDKRKKDGGQMELETRCIKIKLKPETLERVLEWAKTLNETRREEAMATLRDESVILEAYFLDSAPDGDYLIAIMKAESFEKSQNVFEKSTHAIDRYHQQFKKDAWASIHQVKLLVDLDRISEVTS